MRCADFTNVHVRRKHSDLDVTVFILQARIAAPFFVSGLVRDFGIWAFYYTPSKMSNSLALRVEFLLKTESGYLRDAEVTLFTLANP